MAKKVKMGFCNRRSDGNSRYMCGSEVGVRSDLDFESVLKMELCDKIGSIRQVRARVRGGRDGGKADGGDAL